MKSPSFLNNTILKKVFIICFLLCFVKSNAIIWSVGSSQTYPNPSDVVSLVNIGDTIEIDAGTYSGDFCIWNTVLEHNNISYKVPAHHD